MSLQLNSLNYCVCGMDNAAGIKMCFLEIDNDPVQVTSEKVIEDKGRVIQVAGEITDITGTLFAKADGLLMEVDPGNLGSIAPLNGDWKGYPERPNEVKYDR